MLRALTGAAAVLLLSPLAGCGEAGAPSAAEESSPSPTATATTGIEASTDVATDSSAASTGDTDAPGPDASDLADMAEDLAQQQQSVPPRAGPVLGADISWPQCPKGMGIPEKRTLGLPMPLPEAEYVVIGLTNGPGFTPNPCLADQVSWVAERELLGSAYAVVSYPDDADLDEHGDDGPFDGDTRLGALQNVGYQQAEYSIDAMEEAGLETPAVWLDVEPVAHFEWSGDLEANAAVVRGAARGYTDAGYRIGVYSTPYLWEGIVGDLSLGVPEWRAAGQTSRAEALSRCGDDWSIQGGAAVLGQWVADQRDHNVTCPGAAAELGRWFHQY